MCYYASLVVSTVKDIAHKVMALRSKNTMNPNENQMNPNENQIEVTHHKLVDHKHTEGPNPNQQKVKDSLPCNAGVMTNLRNTRG